VQEVVQQVKNPGGHHHAHGGGCPGSQAIAFKKDADQEEVSSASQPSALRQWPVQLHLINPAASYFQGSDLLIAADCTAFAMGDFHSNWLKNKSLVIACPKLDTRTEVYIEKLTALIETSRVNTVTVLIMEVPCCGGLLHMVKTAQQAASRKVPVRKVVVGLQGDILSDEWI